MNSQNLVCNQICITLDVDWARDEVVLRVAEMMKQVGVKATFFATHKSQLLAELDPHQFEVGLHPNFNQADGNFRRPVQELKTLYPRAIGGRSHSLFVSSHILESYMESGLKYECNLFLPYHEALHPVLRFKDLVSIPFYWSDDKHIEFGEPFNLGALRLAAPGLKVLNFHPIHVFMDTYNQEHYQSYKKHYQDPEELKQFVNAEREGVGTLFQSLLDYLARTGKRTYTLREIHEEYITERG